MPGYFVPDYFDGPRVITLFTTSKCILVNRLGSISDISLAGAISTGTHGTGKNFTILSGYVSSPLC